MFEVVITAPEFEIALESLPTDNIESMLQSVGLVDQISPEAGPLDQATMLRIVADSAKEQAMTRIRTAASSVEETLREHSLCLERMVQRLIEHQVLDQRSASADRRVYSNAPQIA